MDPENTVVKLCVQGMEEEGKGNNEQASSLFAQAWAESRNDFERCIAAHYVARHQATAEQTLNWNQQAMHCAHRVCDGSADQFFASLYLNLGKSYEEIGNGERAAELYRCAAARLGVVPPGAYRDIVQDGIERGLLRVGAGNSVGSGNPAGVPGPVA